jgi:hypothetical protein
MASKAWLTYSMLKLTSAMITASTACSMAAASLRRSRPERSSEVMSLTKMARRRCGGPAVHGMIRVS